MNSHLSTCVGTQSPKYLEMAQGHISLSEGQPCLLSSGAPDSPVHTGHCPVPDFLPKMAQPTVANLGAVGAPDMSCAYRTVRCPLPTVGPATCRTQIPRPTVGPADRWLTGQSGAHRTSGEL
jgi:hypothetical protein